MPRLIANVPFPYATRDLRAGEEFDASDSDARILVMIGRAKVAEKTEDGGLGDPVIPADGEPLRRRYRRRDMRAEDR